MEFFASIKEEILVILWGMAPISEIRGAVLIGVFGYDFHPVKAFLLGAFGNILATVPLAYILGRFSEYLMHKIYFVNRILSWLFEYTRKRHQDHFDSWKYGSLALFVFVAIPLPFTGAWSGALASIVFGIPFRKVAWILPLGILTSGVIVVILSQLGIITSSAIAH